MSHEANTNDVIRTALGMMQSNRPVCDHEFKVDIHDMDLGTIASLECTKCGFWAQCNPNDVDQFIEYIK